MLAWILVSILLLSLAACALMARSRGTRSRALLVPVGLALGIAVGSLAFGGVSVERYLTAEQIEQEIEQQERLRIAKAPDRFTAEFSVDEVSCVEQSGRLFDCRVSLEHLYSIERVFGRNWDEVMTFQVKGHSDGTWERVPTA